MLVRNAITAGVGGGMYGVGQPTLRQQMAVFLLKAKYGVCYVPPPCTGTFSDVPCPSTFAAWIEDLADQGITGGCGAGVYCPQIRCGATRWPSSCSRPSTARAYVPPALHGRLTTDGREPPGPLAVDTVHREQTRRRGDHETDR